MARETKHTPGPWVMEIPQESNGYVNIQMGDKFASVYGDIVDNIGHPSEESVATARLISKAPEMLEMLDKIRRFKEYQRVEDFVSIDEIEELIKKIEG